MPAIVATTIIIPITAFAMMVVALGAQIFAHAGCVSINLAANLKRVSLRKSLWDFHTLLMYFHVAFCFQCLASNTLIL